MRYLASTAGRATVVGICALVIWLPLFLIVLNLDKGLNTFTSAILGIILIGCTYLGWQKVNAFLSNFSVSGCIISIALVAILFVVKLSISCSIGIVFGPFILGRVINDMIADIEG